VADGAGEAMPYIIIFTILLLLGLMASCML